MKRPWSTEKLGTVADLRAGYGFPKDLQGRRTGDIPFAKVRDVSAAARSGGELKGADNWIVEEDLERLRAKTVPSGTTLFPKIGEAIRSNNRAFARCELIVDNNVMGAVPRLGKVEPRFLYWWLRKTDLAPLASATTVPSIRKSTLAELDVPVPALDEQRRIVSKIESLFARSRRAKEALDAIPPLLDRLRQSILAAAFRGDLTADWRAQNPDVEPADKLLERIRTERRRRWEQAQLAKMRAKGKEPKNDKWKAKYEEPESVDNASHAWELPTGWVWTTVDTVGDVLLGRQRAPQYLTGRYSRPYLRVANIVNFKVDYRDLKEMDFDETDLEKYRLATGDIVLSEGQSPELVGEPAIYDGEVEDLCFQKTLHRFRPHPPGPKTAFVYLVFRASLHLGTFRAYASLTTNIAHLTLRRFKAVPFPLPPAEEQEAIVARLVPALETLERVRKLALATRTRLRSLEASVLASAFSGRLSCETEPDAAPGQRAWDF